MVDVVAVLTESDRPRKYWNDLKKKLQQEGSELSEEIGQLKMPSSDGKMYKTDCMNTEQLFRLIRSIPSPKAEPFKLWMAQVAKERQFGKYARCATAIFAEDWQITEEEFLDDI